MRPLQLHAQVKSFAEHGKIAMLSESTDSKVETGVKGITLVYQFNAFPCLGVDSDSFPSCQYKDYGCATRIVIGLV